MQSSSARLHRRSYRARGIGGSGWNTTNKLNATDDEARAVAALIERNEVPIAVKAYVGRLEAQLLEHRLAGYHLGFARAMEKYSPDNYESAVQQGLEYEQQRGTEQAEEGTASTIGTQVRDAVTTPDEPLPSELSSKTYSELYECMERIGIVLKGNLSRVEAERQACNILEARQQVRRSVLHLVQEW